LDRLHPPVPSARRLIPKLGQLFHRFGELLFGGVRIAEGHLQLSVAGELLQHVELHHL
jgi:hypothetical protein